jgi:Fe-S-cluster containining protein
MAVWCLAFHAAWHCRHAGACCRAGWSIPIEGPAFEQVRVHFSARADADSLFVHEGRMPEGAAAILGVRRSGACVFFDETAAERRCEIHRTLGEEHLPAACRQFPRVALHDRRGTFVSLSHFCPTAARLLIEPASFDIVKAPAGVALEGSLEGLDATGVLPPLLRPNLLTDPAGYDAWERRAIATLADDRLSAARATAAIAHATQRLEAWTPDNGSLRDAVDLAFGEPDGRVEDPDPNDAIGLFSTVVSSVPGGLDKPAVPTLEPAAWTNTLGLLRTHDRPVRAWLAARLLGNWVAYSAPGLRVVATTLRAYLAVLSIETLRVQDRHELTPQQRFIEAIRGADLLIVHLSDVRTLTPRLARECS